MARGHWAIEITLRLPSRPSKTQSGPHLGSLVLCMCSAGLGRVGFFRRGGMLTKARSWVSGSSEPVILCICITCCPANCLLPAHAANGHLSLFDRVADPQGHLPWSSPVCSWPLPQRWRLWDPETRGMSTQQSLILEQVLTNLINLLILFTSL